MGCCCCSSSHGLRYATPQRTPPDPTLFPHYMQNAQGLWLRFSEWWPEGKTAADVKGVVFMVPGLGEHTGRYDSIALRFTQAGYAVFAVDNQGSGGSEGERLYVERFSHFVDDEKQFIDFVLARRPELADKPRVLLGHSMGGVIAILTALRSPGLFRAVVLSGPGLDPPAMPKPGSFLYKIVSCLSSCMPRMAVAKLAAADVSRNTPVVELVQQDPYYSNASLRARFVAEFIWAQEECFARAARPETAFPFLIVHGADDKLCSPAGSERFFELSPSTDKKLTMYPGAGHEVLTELCRQQVLDEVMEFVNKRCAQCLLL